MTFSIKPNDIQKAVLNTLLEKYNNSKTFKGSNKVKQRFYIKPDDILPEYNDDFSDAAVIGDFESDIAELENECLIKTEKRGKVIIRIYAVQENISQFHELIGTEDKRAELKRAEEILQSYMGRHDVLDKICSAQLERVKNFQTQNIAQNNDKMDKLLKCVDFILQNNAEILERELSIELFGDSKFFEKELKTKVCSLLENFGVADARDLAEDEKGIKKERLLSQYLIVKNPTYFYFKGNGLLTFSDGKRIELSSRRPIALRSDSVADISSITTPCGTVMTIENLTSFNRLHSDELFCLFLSGYNNSCKTDFLKMVYRDNPQKKWLHFGDIDPDGFYILHNLRIKTDIDFHPYLMGTVELDRYKRYCKKLEPNDIAKANSLAENNIFPEIAQYMLDNNRKLEQEIISWKTMQKAALQKNL